MTIALSLGHRTVTVSGQTQIVNEKGKKVALSLVYPPPHLYHILFELFKNSMRAVVESHGTRSELPNIEVLVAKGEHDVMLQRKALEDKIDKCAPAQAPARPPSPAAAQLY